MKKRITKVDRAYDDFEKRYSHMSSEEFTKAISERIKELESKIIKNESPDYAQKINDLQATIKNKRDLIDKFRSRENIKTKEIIQRIETEIKEAEKEIEKITTEAEKNNKNNISIEKEIANLTINARGYLKYKDQIIRIKKYQKILENKLEQQIKIRNSSKFAIDKAEKELTKVEDEFGKVTRELDDLKQKLSDETFAKIYIADGSTLYRDLLDRQHNLLRSKNNLENIIKENKTKYEESKARILDLQSKIAKCNMAWKSLFEDKDWDCIQTRALARDSRYRRATPEKEARLTGKKDRHEENRDQSSAAQDSVVQDTATKESATQDTATRGSATQNTATQDTVTRGATTQDTATQDTAARGSATQDTVAQDTVIQDTIDQDPFEYKETFSDADLFMTDKYPEDSTTTGAKEEKALKNKKDPFWRRVWNRIRRFFKPNDKTAKKTSEGKTNPGEEKQKPKAENINNDGTNKKTVDENIRNSGTYKNTVNENISNNGTGKNTVNQNIRPNEAVPRPVKQPERDEFIEGLRKYADVDYRQRVMEVKDIEYRKKHEPKVNHHNEQDDDRDDR